MAVNAISSKTSAQLPHEGNVNAVQKKAEAGAATQVKQAQTVRTAEKTEKPTPAAQAVESNNQQQHKVTAPFINTNGEKTGTHINTTA